MLSLSSDAPTKGEVEWARMLPPVRAGASLPAHDFEAVRRACILRFCKWDPQVGDQATLAPFPLLLGKAVALQLDAWAERLACEAMAAEEELLGRPTLWEALAVPRAIRQVLQRDEMRTPAAGRVMRFDFHPCTEGWRLSEVNADVPGGFTEATEFTKMMAERHPGTRRAGEPGPAWADAIAQHGGTGALLVAPGFIEDLQVVAYLGELLRARGCRLHLAQPQHLKWKGGVAHLDMETHRGALDFVVRFFQAEWLPREKRGVDWQKLFAGGLTPVANPGIAVLLESKRFPLVWESLRTPLPTWRALLPETRPLPLRAASSDAEWMLKSAYSNNGDHVLNRDLTPPPEWMKSTRWLAFSRRQWLQQRRFHSIPLPTPWGPMHTCIGVYTVNGKACGMYGRLSRGPIVDFRASDAAVLIEEGT